jgi:uncharacterized SAM-binding protein YcdF (DUF218 family)
MGSALPTLITMFFVLQKIIWFLIVPPSSLFLLILAGMLLINRRRKISVALIAFGLGLLYLLSLGPVADAILRPLERQAPPLHDDRLAAVDAVVVPGGGSVDLEWMGAKAVPNAETLSRLVVGVRLAKKLNVPLVLCGGNGEPFVTTVRDADAMERSALEMGLPQKQLIVERESRNTLENSHAVRTLVRGDCIILATSAYYMRRARAMFERRGFTVIPASAYHLAQSRNPSASLLIPGASNLFHSTQGIAEWISMSWWSLRGEM